MSTQCEVRISFDRPDRTWRGGEMVSGRVAIDVLQQTQTNGIRLTHLWKTHGRGNVDSGAAETIVLAEAGVLSSGETLEFPFSFTAPTHPLTYRGQLIFIDHYVTAEVDVSWARNPRAEEEFILLPGQVPPQFAGRRDEIVSLKEVSSFKPGLLLKIILFALMGVVLAALAMMAVILIPIILIISAVVWMKRRALKSRLGDVTLELPHKIVAPGEAWPVSISFTARRAFQLNRISVTLTGIESAASGSGTDKTTHTHSLLKDEHLMLETTQIEAGQAIQQRVLLTFPETRAFSFEGSDNSIKWTADVRIDLPRFPDWVESVPLQVVPSEFLTDFHPPGANAEFSGQSGNDSAAAWTRDSDGAEVQEDRSDDAEPQDEDQPVSLRTPEAAKSIRDLVAQLDAVSRHSSRRTEIVRASAGVPMQVSVSVDRIVSGGIAPADNGDWTAGKSVTGTIDGTRQTIQILAAPEATAILETLRAGDLWTTVIQVTDWDSLYHRINARQMTDAR